ncbi:uncharacterized protein LOC130815629 [Amaranthus tricolor]|uniref:uncharacterized protein LOC130815629 n=1 Tax=Amaranthus tricolor TaxID=29722 RepID=UPI002590116F|nr:uncharacterized protein LOC130815629 [Amaranthus tricolor]
MFKKRSVKTCILPKNTWFGRRIIDWRSRGRKFWVVTLFFRPLYRHVSIYVLEQLQLEYNRMLELGDDVLNKCGYVLQQTQGLPCACYLHMCIGSHGALYVDDIHQFWSTLRYTEVEDETYEGVRYANANDIEYFQSLVDEVLKSDPAVVRRMSQRAIPKFVSIPGVVRRGYIQNSNADPMYNCLRLLYNLEPGDSFGRALLYGYELPSFFSPQTLSKAFLCAGYTG